MTIRFVIPGPPCAKGRPRIGINRGTGRAMAFTDRKTENYEGLVCMAAQTVRPPSPLAGAVAVEIVAVFGRPAYLLKRSVRTGRLLQGDEGRMPHVSRPDLDNVVKAVLDGLNRSGLWTDDAQIADLRATKFYASTDETPHVEVMVASREAETAATEGVDATAALVGAGALL